jgi:SAM-dependent methyltransferase
VWRIVERRCGLGPGTTVLEIGPGTGIATRELIRRGAGPLVLVEPDRRLVRFLRGTLAPGRARVTIVPQRFERARLPQGAFDLAVAASSFHWVPPRAGLRRVARALRPGGWWASWSARHGDPYRPSPFHDALQPLYRALHGDRRRWDGGRSSDRRERAHRFAALRAVGGFDRIRRDDVHWSVRLRPSQVVALWATFSDIQTLPPRRRRWFLSEMERIVRSRFRDRVTLRVLTAVYTARRVAGPRPRARVARGRETGRGPSRTSSEPAPRSPPVERRRRRRSAMNVP